MDVCLLEATDGGFRRGRESGRVKRNAAEKGPTVLGHGVVEPEVGACALASIRLE